MAVVPRRSSLPRSERSMFSSSDDNATMRQIQATHAPDGREFAVKHLLRIVEDIFQRAALGITSIVQHQVK
uniref:Sieve element occlusion N-terminal domain-containing protein n=1 Tax=Rhizophora mucronata TaxID=61149 RepID=A0A2P2JAK9_RHIMU